MKRILRFVCLGHILWSTQLSADSEALPAVRQLENEWATIFYALPSQQHADRFRALLPRVQALAAQFPRAAEPRILEAIVLCTYAGADVGFSSLAKLERARDLLTQAIDIDPKAMEGSAYISLGNLYYRLPGWPISFGDDEAAETYLEAAHRLFPKNIDTNYFYGDYLLSQGEPKKALPYLEAAAQAPIRPHMELNDRKLKEEVEKSLNAAREKRSVGGDFFSGFMPSFDRD